MFIILIGDDFKDVFTSTLIKSHTLNMYNMFSDNYVNNTV